MTRSLSGSVDLAYDLQYKNTTGEISDAIAAISPQKPQAWTSGTGSNQHNRYFEEIISLAASAVNRDLFGSLTDIYGNTLSFVDIRSILIHNKSSVAGEVLTIDGNFIERIVLSGTTPTLKLDPGGVLYLTNPIDGYSVTNTTDERITLDPGAKTFAVDLIVTGTE